MISSTVDPVKSRLESGVVALEIIDIARSKSPQVPFTNNVERMVVDRELAELEEEWRQNL